MNTKELIERIEGLNKLYGDNKNYVSYDDVLNLVKQLDEPQKITIPKFVADYIEFKKKYDFHIYGAMRTIEDYEDKRVPNWFYEGNIEKFCLAWILGYEVEKEKRYWVNVKGTQSLNYLNRETINGIWYMGNIVDLEPFTSRHTRKELEEAGFGEVFNSPLFEVEEVENE